MHVLVVGGTGMLRDLSLELARRFDTVSVVARGAAQLSGINPLTVDYHSTAALAAAVRKAVARFGPIDLAVTWIHSTAPEALGAVTAELAQSGRSFRLFHVRGSGAADPDRPGAKPQVPDLCQYRQVILGWTDGRWLTNAEISAGVLTAIDADQPEHIVGVVRPWHERPV